MPIHIVNFKRNIKKLQEQAPRIPNRFSQLEYEERLRRLNLTTLKWIKWVIPIRLRSELELKGPTKK